MERLEDQPLLDEAILRPELIEEETEEIFKDESLTEHISSQITQITRTANRKVGVAGILVSSSHILADFSNKDCVALALPGGGIRCAAFGHGVVDWLAHESKTCIEV